MWRTGEWRPTQAGIRKTSSYSCPLLRKWFPNKSKALMQASLQHLSQEKSSHGWTVNMKKAPSRAMGRSWLSVVPPRFRMIYMRHSNVCNGTSRPALLELLSHRLLKSEFTKVSFGRSFSRWTFSLSYRNFLVLSLSLRFTHWRW